MTDIAEPQIQLNGKVFRKVEISTIPLYFEQYKNDAWFLDFTHFVSEWFSDSDFIETNTSGTTGKPRPLKLSKRSMLASAQRTIHFFHLSNHHSLALCLPCNFIAGRMMVVRALLAKANLILMPPSTQLNKYIKTPIDFIAIVPNQLNSFFHLPKKITEHTTVLLGGAPLQAFQLTEIKKHHTQFYHSYASTETASHVALKKLSAPLPDKSYRALPGITFSMNKDGTLNIHSDFLDHETFVTNDIARFIDNKHFEWLGRMDNIINSAGIKIAPEEIEQKIAHLIPERFYVIGAPDSTYGQKPILVIEGETSCDNTENVLQKINILLPKTHAIKSVQYVHTIETTSTGKIKRNFFKQ